MNHIGAKTENTPQIPSAWEQLAQTQNYEHPIRQQGLAQAISSPVKPPSTINNQPVVQAAPALIINNNNTSNNSVNNNQQQSPQINAPAQQPPAQQQQTTQQAADYGEELHPELVNKLFPFLLKHRAIGFL
jgi:hypothetical protein